MRKLLRPFVLLAVLASCAPAAPRIDSIDPRVGNTGEILTVRGAGFGAERGDGKVSISGIAPTASSYIEWSDDRISVRIPDFGDSGLVYVHVRGKVSNPALYTNRAALPQPVARGDGSSRPRVLSADPPAARIGAAVTLHGRNFGASREGGAVLFAWDAETPPSAQAAARAPYFVEAPDHEYAYELWSDREIRVRVPDGASSGSLVVRTARGSSDPIFFDIADRAGSKTFRDKKTFAFSYSVNVKAESATAPNSIYLWMPLPASSASQRNAQILSRSAEPFVEGHRGAALYQLNDLKPGTSDGVSVSCLVDVYAVETKVNAAAVKKLPGSPVAAAYAAPSPLLPSADASIAKAAASIVGKEKNPYSAAKRIYDWMLAGVRPAEEGLQPAGPVEALASMTADPYAAALLFCTLARAADIPAVPIAGFLVDRTRKPTRHWWAEFWIDGLGWVPVDPALALGLGPEGFSAAEDPKAYYFGNVDGQRIAFSRGQASIARMDPRGRAVGRERAYAFQTIWEEALGGLESYSSLWSDLAVNGVY